MAQRGGGSGINTYRRNTQSQLYSMPPPLIQVWLDAVTEASASMEYAGWAVRWEKDLYEPHTDTQAVQILSPPPTAQLL
eukprot:11091554-Karenia_brevis.AAC.1